MNNKKILILTSASKSLFNFRGSLIELFLKNGMDVYALSPKDKDYEDTQRWFMERGAKIVPIRINNTGLNPIYDIKTILDIYVNVRKIKPDIILSYGIKPVIYGSLSGCAARCKKIVSMITGLGNCFMEENQKTLLYKCVKFLYKVALSVNKKVFFQNEDDRDLFVQNRITKKEKTVLINGSGVDIEYFSYNGPSLNPIRFLFIGRLIKQKGIIEFIEAAKTLKKKYPEVLFSVVGGRCPNPSSISDAEFEEIKNSPHIEYLGELKDVREILRKSSVFVLPSYREGTSRACLEAMASGLPVITTDAPGCRQTVEEGVNGFLVPVKNHSLIIEKIEYFINNRSEINIMGEKSFQIVKKKFDSKKINDTIFQEIL